MNPHEVQEALVKLGWPLKIDGSYGPVTRTAVADFQHMYTPENLSVDGGVGPATEKALLTAVYFGGHCSEHFTFRDFADHSSHWIRGNRTLIRGLEAYRRLIGGRPVRIVSGYRDPRHNKTVGGAELSQHQYGGAADIDEVATLARVRGLHVFSGIGVQRSNDKVRHVDVRGQDGAPRTTGGTPAHPTVWYY